MIGVVEGKFGCLLVSAEGENVASFQRLSL